MSAPASLNGVSRRAPLPAGIGMSTTVPLMNGRLKLITDGGVESFAEHKAGQPYYRNVGVEHDVINDGDGEYAFIEVEVK